MSILLFNNLLYIILYSVLVYLLLFSIYDIIIVVKEYRILKPNILFCSSVTKTRILISILSVMVITYGAYLSLKNSKDIDIRFILTSLIPIHVIIIPIVIFLGVLTKVAITDKGLIVFAPLALPVKLILWEDINNVKFNVGSITFNYSKKEKRYKIELNSLNIHDKSFIIPILRKYLQC